MRLLFDAIFALFLILMGFVLFLAVLALILWAL